VDGPSLRQLRRKPCRPLPNLSLRRTLNRNRRMRDRIPLRVRNDHPLGVDTSASVTQPSDLRRERLEVSVGCCGTDTVAQLKHDRTDSV